MKSPDTGINTPEQKSPEFREGDRVRLTEEKIEELKKGGFLEGLSQLSGVVSSVFEEVENELTVDLGGKVMRVRREDITKEISEPQLESQRRESSTILFNVAAGVSDADRQSPQAGKEAFLWSDLEFEVIKRLAYDNDDKPKDPELRKQLKKAILKLQEDRPDLLQRSVEEIVILITKELE